MTIIWTINDMFVYYWFTSVEHILVPVCDTCNMCYSRSYIFIQTLICTKDEAENIGLDNSSTILQQIFFRFVDATLQNPDEQLTVVHSSFQWDGNLSQCDNGDQDPGYWDPIYWYPSGIPVSWIAQTVYEVQWI